MKLFRGILRQSQYLNFAADSRLAEFGGTETFVEYLERLGVTQHLQLTLGGFLEMTMGRVEHSGGAYMRTYLAEMLLNAHKLYVPEKGARALSEALADACGDTVRVSTFGRRFGLGHPCDLEPVELARSNTRTEPAVRGTTPTCVHLLSLILSEK